MMAETYRAAEVLGKVQMAFERIGKTNSLKCPPSTDNVAPEAWEYMVASVLASQAKKRAEKAKERAFEVGILGDPDYAKPSPGEVVFDGTHVIITRQVKNPSNSLNKTKLRVELLKRMPEEEVDKIIEAATVPAKPAKVFTATPRDVAE